MMSCMLVLPPHFLQPHFETLDETYQHSNVLVLLQGPAIVVLNVCLFHSSLEKQPIACMSNVV